MVYGDDAPKGTFKPVATPEHSWDRGFTIVLEDRYGEAFRLPYGFDSKDEATRLAEIAAWYIARNGVEDALVEVIRYMDDKQPH